jgi:hypothetical protein
LNHLDIETLNHSESKEIVQERGPVAEVSRFTGWRLSMIQWLNDLMIQ